MNKVILIMIVILVVPYSYAYEVKFYHPNINQIECFETLNEFQPEDFGIKRINIYQNTNSQYMAYYFYGGKINLYRGCNKHHIAHELAHAVQDREGNRLNHDQNFYKIVEVVKWIATLN